MDPVTGAILGGVVEGGLGFLGASKANKSNREMAREQMAFQERMSSTAYQRAMSDMAKAGLNPILAGKLGGASAPPGAQATAQNELAGFTGTTARALEQRKAKAEVANLEEMRRQIISQTLLNESNSAKASQEAKILGYKASEHKLRSNVVSDVSSAYDVVKGKIQDTKRSLTVPSVTPEEFRKGKEERARARAERAKSRPSWFERE